jgi:ZIP family zinc transporter
MPVSLQAGLWGLLSGSALLLGALVGWFVPVKQRAVAANMEFGAGVLISALSFELVDEAWRQGGFAPMAGGFLAGALVYTLANYWLSHRGARHRKRSQEGNREAQADKHPNNSSALALGALLDGIPESIVIGVSLLKGPRWG